MIDEEHVNRCFEEALEACRSRGIVPGSIVSFEGFFKVSRVGAQTSLLIRRRQGKRDNLITDKTTLILGIVRPVIPVVPELMSSGLYSATLSSHLFSTETCAVFIVLRRNEIMAAPLQKFVTDSTTRTDANFNGIKVIARG